MQYPLIMKKTILRIISLITVLLLVASCGERTTSSNDAQIVKSSIVATPGKFWQKNHTLIITFLDGSSEQKNEVEVVSKEITKYANLNFAFYNSVSNVPRGKKIDILISFNKAGNNSAVGTDSQYSVSKGNHSMSLSELSKNSAGERRGTILHEFGHAIGLQHEHQNIHRTFKIDEALAKEYCKNVYKFTEEDCRDQIINTLPNKENQNYYSKYDPASVMHYTLHSSVTKEKIDFANVNSLSLIDKLEIAKLYPGRISEKEIILGHNILKEEIKKIETVGNCIITRSEAEVIRLNESQKPELMKVNYYSYSSINPSEYNASTLIEDKEGLLFSIRNDSFCNYNESELAEFRIKSQQENLEMSKFGNCEIPLTKEGLPKPNLCDSKYPFQVFEIKKQESANNSCYPTFKSAYESMKETEYCSLKGTALVAFEKERNQKFEASRKFGRCYVENYASSEGATSYRRCSLEHQWFVTIDRNKTLNNFCYGDPDSLIKDIQSEPKCL